jgi:hypothetical protein
MDTLSMLEILAVSLAVLAVSIVAICWYYRKQDVLYTVRRTTKARQA